MANIMDITPELDNLSVSRAYMSTYGECHKLVNFSTNSKFSVIHMNVRSVTKNFDQFRVLLCSLKISCDIIILSECWLSKADTLPDIEGYKRFSTSRNSNQNAGIIMFIKSNLKNYSVAEPFVEESNCLICKIDSVTAIVASYRSPSHKNCSKFIDSLNSILSNLASFKNVILIGDINLDIKIGFEDQRSNEYLNVTAFHGLLPAHRFPTRYENCLDHVLVKTCCPASTLVLEATITDHSPVILCLDHSSLKRNKNQIVSRTNYPAVLKDIENKNFSLIYSMSDVNEATDTLINIIKSVIDTHTISTIIPCRQRIIKPWITIGLLRCIHNRDNMHKTLKKQPDNLVLKITYKRYRNFCNILLRKLKCNYEKSEFDKARNNPKKTWEVIKKVTDTSRTRSSPSELLNISHNASLSVNEVNRYFANIGKDLADKITPNPNYVPPAVGSNPVSPSNSLTLLEVTAEDIRAIILNLRSDAAAGWDGISSKFLKSAEHTLTPIITFICNLAIRTGKFPRALKKAMVLPIHKSGDRMLVNNYRPISILPSLSKILERVINTALVSFLENNSLLSKNQFGFRKSLSTEDAVLSLTDFLVKKIDDKYKCLGIFLDLSKAFDTVSVPLLIKKLEKFGVRGIALDLLIDYLTDRTQFIKIDSHISDTLSVNYGVPQGSILGPTLFLIYVNELCNITANQSSIFAYADDTAIIAYGRTWEETIAIAESVLSLVMTWLTNNLLTLNILKTKYLTFAIRPSDHPQELSIHAHTCQNPPVQCSCLALSRVKSIKYLGVVLDCCLNWYEHLNYLMNRTRKLIFIFKKLRNSADNETLRMAYTALCESILTYCIPAWGGSSKTTFIDLERSQRAVLKVLFRKPFRYPTKQLYSELSLLTVRQLYILRATLRRHASAPTRTKDAARRRPKPPFHNFDVRTTFAKKQFSYQSSKLYNYINNSLDLISSTKYKCKNKLKIWLLTLDYDSTESIIK